MINENTRDHRQMRARGGRFGASLVAGTLVALALACGGAWAQSTPESASLTRADTDEQRIGDLVVANQAENRPRTGSSGVGYDP